MLYQVARLPLIPHRNEVLIFILLIALLIGVVNTLRWRVPRRKCRVAFRCLVRRLGYEAKSLVGTVSINTHKPLMPSDSVFGRRSVGGLSQFELLEDDINGQGGRFVCVCVYVCCLL